LQIVSDRCLGILGRVSLIYRRSKWSGHSVLVIGPRNLPVFMQAAPAASHDTSILALFAPAILHRATASLHVVARAEAIVTKVIERIIIAERRMAVSTICI
jgi:hypothetical protein